MSIISDRYPMVLIPSGSLTLAKDGRRVIPSEKIGISDLNVNAFELGKYAVTNELWQALMGNLPRSDFQQDPKKPVTDVNWYEVQDFIERLNTTTQQNYRLPTELEWAYAARAGTKERSYLIEYELYYQQDNDSSEHHELMNFDGFNEGPVTVGSYPESPWGLCEMYGNVFEWVASYEGPYSTYDEGYDVEAVSVLYGGCWKSKWKDLVYNGRIITDKADWGMSGCYGFRLARDLN